ncbi:MAG: hypothetical protein ACPGL0_15765, partial [Limisphaerales bacterium]
PPNARNYPIRPHTKAKDHRKALLRALEDVHAFQPDLVGVSAGFDAYRLDPLAQASLEVEDYLWIGEQVALLPCPAFAILEGGYSEDLGQLVEAFLLGWSISTGEHMDPQGSNLQPTMKTR